MKTLEQSIEILEKYLHYEINVDSMYNYETAVSRKIYIERDLYWILYQCSKEDVNSNEITIPIGGCYIVDKENGNIYIMGSSPAFDWNKEFTNFKESNDSSIDWKPLKNDYLDCKLNIESKFNYSEEYITCYIREREQKIEHIIKTRIMNGNDKCFIFFKPFDYEPGKLRIGINLRTTNQKIKVVSKIFNGNLKDSSTTLNQLRKYLRINNYKATGNYWIEVKKENILIDYPNWNFEYKMEYIHKEAPANTV